MTRPFARASTVAGVIALLASAALAGISHGYSTPRLIPARKSSAGSTTSASSSTPSSSPSSPSSSSSSIVVPVDAYDAVLDRCAFLAYAATTSCLGLLLSFDVTDAGAREIDPSLRGTKADPSFQYCLSECVYECTKPKGNEQKSRAECIPECKAKCATSKAQLMLGTATKKG
ncbi:hypothetical protein ACHAXA_006270 [Cyclostephanos tholiformis]|uniref:Uncharacterized protein n=1 Tax=Cyclostephanos tholiformis TaxID=382380 RepID=A0ABD3SP03_9STRA